MNDAKSAEQGWGPSYKQPWQAKEDTTQPEYFPDGSDSPIRDEARGVEGMVLDRFVAFLKPRADYDSEDYSAGILTDCWHVSTADLDRALRHVLTPNPVRAEQPEGMVLVPREPTEAMRAAGRDAHYEAEEKAQHAWDVGKNGMSWRENRAAHVYAAMLTAAPEPVLAAAPAAPGVRVDAWRGVAAEAFTNIKRSCIRGRNAANMETEKNFVATCDHIENLADEGIAALAPDGGEEE